MFDISFAPFSFKAVPVKSARIVDRPRRCNSGWAFAAVVQVRHRQAMVVRPGSSPGGGFFERLKSGGAVKFGNTKRGLKWVKLICKI